MLVLNDIVLVSGGRSFVRIICYHAGIDPVIRRRAPVAALIGTLAGKVMIGADQQSLHTRRIGEELRAQCSDGRLIQEVLTTGKQQRDQNNGSGKEIFVIYPFHIAVNFESFRLFI